jgi:hypothetical protein
MKQPGFFLVCCAFVLFCSGCSKDDTPQSSSGSSGQIKMYMTDAPGTFDAVNIVVMSVEVHAAGSDSTAGWFTVNNTPHIYNLLDLANGRDTVVGTATLAAGTYTQIRLIIGSGSNVVIAGIPFNLEIPSGMQTGLKLNHPFTISANVTYELTLDFNAERSITLTGNGTYRLNPVIRVQSNDNAGTISGTVFQTGARATVWTNVGGDTVSTTADTLNGSFKLSALPEGAYSIKFSATLGAYRDTTVNGVVVQRQQDTNVGTVVLPSQ